MTASTNPSRPRSTAAGFRSEVGEHLRGFSAVLTRRVVHVVPLPTDEQAGVVGALCGAALGLADIETVTPGEGMPCTVCLVTQTLRTSNLGTWAADGKQLLD